MDAEIVLLPGSPWLVPGKVSPGPFAGTPKLFRLQVRLSFPEQTARPLLSVLARKPARVTGNVARRPDFHWAGNRGAPDFLLQPANA